MAGDIRQLIDEAALSTWLSVHIPDFVLPLVVKQVFLRFSLSLSLLLDFLLSLTLSCSYSRPSSRPSIWGGVLAILICEWGGLEVEYGRANSIASSCFLVSALLSS